jgi:hypothetical protein
MGLCQGVGGAHTVVMDIERAVWLRSASRVQRVAKVARVVWGASTLVPPLVALTLLPALLAEAVVAAVVSLEGRAPGAPARSSSPWVWAMGGGGM